VSDVRRASTICVVRDAPDLEVLMVRRPWTSRFMPGVWVFPGGAVDDGDAAPPAAFGRADDWTVAALRELIEETGIWFTEGAVVERGPTTDAFGDVTASGLALDPGAFAFFANWITPEVFPLRFDTRFFLAVAPSGIEGTIDGDELVDLAWVHPLEALAREEDGEWDVAFPTRKTLEVLASGSSAGDLMERVRSVGAVPPIQPRLFVGDDEARIVLPGEDRFDEIADDQRDPDLLVRLAEVVRSGGRVPAEFRRRS
jgi:8-oxo-dGTP pyrophosphatase MutT (NUDIX family)